MASFMRARLLFAVSFVVLAGAGRAAAKVFTVGDSAGWTILNMPNYTAWASGKTFRVGDTLLFRYNKQFHNVLEVNQDDFTRCNNSSPLNKHTTGDDSILINTVGHHYFMCGVPGHCQFGQKVDIFAVGSAGGAPSSSAAPSTSPSGSPGFAPSPTGSSAAAPASAGCRLAARLPVFIGFATALWAIITLLMF